MGYRIGIDVGSKTVKVVVLDEDGAVVRSIYRRHLANVRTTLSHVLRDLIDEGGDLSGPVAFTGSAGLALSEALGVRHVQEVVATTRAVRSAYPRADAFIELGGEDAKIVYLSGGLEQRMNATCAGGTGGFIDTLAGMLGVKASGMNRLARRAKRRYPIASRCAVFAQTDVRPLLNSGADPQDIALSVLDAVVRQTLGGLACGRPLKGTVVFLGGPLEHIPVLVDLFRGYLHLDEETGIKPYQAHLFTAVGAAMDAAEHGPAMSLSQLADACARASFDEEGFPRLSVLFSDERGIRAFKNRHSALKWPRVLLRKAEGPLFLGFDAGSTTVKLVVVDAQGRLAHSEYRPNHGDAFAVASAMLAHVWHDLPEGAFIARAAATGYGEDLLRAGLGVDDGVVETLAHARAACHVRPEVSFVLDIGGQDMKALWVRDGNVVDAVLNEACSSGCGAFLEGTAYALGSTPDALANAALRAPSPIDLGTKCTVFMSSRVKHAQKIGASLADLGAGLAYSVVRNALFRIIGANRVDSLGPCVMVQGGAFKSDAVLRAFEQVVGRECLRPDTAHLMGALGAALIAREHWAAIRGGALADKGRPARSALIDAEQLRRLNPKRTEERCGGCPNACVLTVVDFGEGRVSVSGNRCARGAELHGSSSAATASPPNLVKLEQRLLASYGDVGAGSRASVRIGILTSLTGYETLPFWRTLFKELGFSVLVEAGGTEDAPCAEALESVPSESACYPAKRSHSQLFALARDGADALFAPRYVRGRRCPVQCGYAEALEGDLPGTSLAGVPLLSPMLSSTHPERVSEGDVDRDSLLSSLAAILPPSSAVGADELDSAWRKAADEQEFFIRSMASGALGAFRWLEEDPSRHVMVLACRPYHIDPSLLHDVDEVLCRLGFAVIPPLAVEAARRFASDDPLAKPFAVGFEAASARWPQAKRLVRLASAAAAHPRVDAVFLRSFGCVMDAIGLEEAREVLERAGKPFTVLKVDDIVDTSHVRIRLRTLAETISLRKAPGTCRPSRSEPVSMPRASASSDSLPFEGAADGSFEVDIMDEPAGWSDVECARSDAPSDLCFTASVLAARLIRCARRFAEDRERAVFLVPEVCRECVLDALPGIARRACGFEPRVRWTRDWHPRVDGCADTNPRKGGCPHAPAVGGSAARPASDPDACPSVGILGNPLLVSQSSLNGGAAAVLSRAGCEPKAPDPALLYEDDIRYLAQLDRWYADGIRDVVYLHGFGCLKGHASVRGSLRKLARRYPGMRITVIDCDAEASDLNRENRLRLAAEAAKAAIMPRS